MKIINDSASTNYWYASDFYNNSCKLYDTYNNEFYVEYDYILDDKSTGDFSNLHVTKVRMWNARDLSPKILIKWMNDFLYNEYYLEIKQSILENIKG